MTVAGFRIASRLLDTSGVQLFLSDSWVFGSGSAMPSTPVSKLTNDILSDYFAAYNHRASNIWVETFGSPNVQSIGCIGILGVNRRGPLGVTNVTTKGYTSNTLRIRVDTYQLSDRIRPPFTITSKTNLTGVNANFTGHPIDPPDDPAPAGYAETKLTPTSLGSATSLIGTWTNPYATERALSGTQTVRIHVRDANNPTLVPLVTATIYQSGSPTINLVSPSFESVVVSNSSGGFIVSYTFSASSLASQTAVMELRVSTTTACDFIGLELVANHTGYVYDSGSKDLSDQDVGNCAVNVDLTALTGNYWVHIQPSDFCSYGVSSPTLVGGGTVTAKSYTSIVNPGDPDGRFHAGRFIAADTATFPISNTGGWNVKSASSISLSRTRSGSLHGSRFPVEWTEADMLLPAGSLSRPMIAKIERILKAIGIMQYPTLLIPDPNMMEGVIERINTPRWMMLSDRQENHVGRMNGIASDVLSDGLNHSFDRYDLQLHWIEHYGSKYGGGS